MDNVLFRNNHILVIVGFEIISMKYGLSVVFLKISLCNIISGNIGVCQLLSSLK